MHTSVFTYRMQNTHIAPTAKTATDNGLETGHTDPSLETYCTAITQDKILRQCNFHPRQQGQKMRKYFSSKNSGYMVLHFCWSVLLLTNHFIEMHNSSSLGINRSTVLISRNIVNKQHPITKINLRTHSQL